MKINSYHLASNIYNTNKNSAINANLSNLALNFARKKDKKSNGVETLQSEKLGIFKSVIFFRNSEMIQRPPLDEDLFFIRMYGYNKDYCWASQMNNLALNISDMISKNVGFDKILETIEKNIEIINMDRGWYGNRRKYDKYVSLDKTKRGCEYLKTYKKFLKENEDPLLESAKAKPNDKYKDAKTCRISKKVCPPYDTIKIIYPRVEFLCGKEKDEATNLHLVKREYEELKSIKKPSLDEINHSVATIHWLMAQGVPYGKGSDSIANILTKSIYHSYGIKTSPAKEGKSFDFEAFYRNLDDYIKIYPEIFETPPYKPEIKKLI